MTLNNSELENMAELLHLWYLKATRKLDPENYNPKAQKPYAELNEQQKDIDRYIAEKTLALIHTETQRAVEEAKKSAVEHYEQFAVYMIPEGGDMSINAVPLSVIKLNLATINQSKEKS